MQIKDENLQILADLLGEDKAEYIAIAAIADAKKSAGEQKAIVEKYLEEGKFSYALAHAKASALECRFELLQLVLMRATEAGPFSVAKQAADDLGMSIITTDLITVFERLVQNDWAEAILCTREFEGDFKRVAQANFINLLCDRFREAKAELQAAQDTSRTHLYDQLKTRCATVEHYLKAVATLDKKPNTQNKNQSHNQSKKQQSGVQGGQRKQRP